MSDGGVYGIQWAAEATRLRFHRRYNYASCVTHGA